MTQFATYVREQSRLYEQASKNIRGVHAFNIISVLLLAGLTYSPADRGWSIEGSFWQPIINRHSSLSPSARVPSFLFNEGRFDVAPILPILRRAQGRGHVQNTESLDRYRFTRMIDYIELESALEAMDWNVISPRQEYFRF